MMVQLTGLSGSGKTTLAQQVKTLFLSKSLHIEIIDADLYRKTLCRDLGFSKEDRQENIRRLAMAAASFMKDNCIPVIAAINPFEITRNEVKKKYAAKTAWIKCDMDILMQRDTKGLYKRAHYPDDHPDKLFNLTGVNDSYEAPTDPDLVIDTGIETVAQSAQKLYQLILDLHENARS